MIQTETTPNPDSLKFLSEKTISAIGTEEFQKVKKNEVSIPFVKELLSFKGVELILLSEKFLSVKKTKEVSWNELKPMVISHLNDYFEKNNEPILKNKQKTSNNAVNEDETVNKIIEVLDTKVRPAVARDGGDIKFKSFEKKSCSAASLGQVHIAESKDGVKLACKLQYPEMQSAIEADLKVVKPFSSMDEEAFRSVDVAPPILAGVLIVLAVMSP